MNRRTTAWLQALLVLLGLSLVLAAPVGAAPLPDPDETGTLHITKLRTPTAGAGNGTQVDPPPSNAPIAGVTFTVKRVQGIDLTTNAGWLAADELADDYAAATPTDVASAEAAVSGATPAYTLGAGDSRVTGADGQVVFDDLPLGLYLVEETDVPPGVTRSAPFFVTLPLSDPVDGDEWLYDVFVYPKNGVTSATKAVEDSASRELGDPVVFTVTADVPDATGPGSTVRAFRVTDTLDPRLTYDPAGAPATADLVDDTPDVSLVAGVDYQVTWDAAARLVTVDVLGPGLAKLTAHRDARVVVRIPTVANTTGEITNVAQVYPDPESIADDEPLVTNEVETKWGSVTVQKVNPEGEALAGAEFQVFTSEADALAQADPVRLGGTDTFVAGPGGELTIEGLRYSAFADDTVVDAQDGANPDHATYYLVETKAPAGYSLLAEPIPFTVDAETTAIGIDLTVTNGQVGGGFALPFTGGPGVTLLYLAASLLLAGAAVLSVRRRVPTPR